MNRMTKRRIKGGIYLAMAIVITAGVTHYIDKTAKWNRYLNARHHAYLAYLRDKCPTGLDAYFRGYRDCMSLTDERRKELQKQWKEIDQMRKSREDNVLKAVRERLKPGYKEKAIKSGKDEDFDR